MLWFERPFLAVLRHEYSQAMRFTEDESAEVMPAAPATPCQLYVHVPFCEVLCPFCSFHRVRYNPAKTGRYFEALRREIRLYHEKGFRFSDVYVGGGTPTVNADELLATLELVRSLSPVRAVSIETNPNHLDPDDLRRYRDAGVTRLSVGVQSFDDGLLAGMDRLEKYGSSAVIRSRLAAVQGIFPTLNVDMIFNLPGQTLAMLEHDLDVLQALRGRPGVVLPADDRAHRAAQDGKEHGAQRPERCATRCTSGSCSGCSASTRRRPRGASRATRACSTSTSSTRTTTSASAAARSATWAAPTTRRRSR